MTTRLLTGDDADAPSSTSSPRPDRSWQVQRPLTSRERLAWWSLLALSVGLLVAGTALWIGSYPDYAAFALLQAFGTSAVAATGLLVWARRPDTPLGALLVLGACVQAFLTFAELVSEAEGPVAGVAGVVSYVLLPWAPGILAHTYLTFPDGRIRGTVSRWLLVSWYGLLPAVRLAGATLGDFAYTLGCGADCPANPVQIADLPGDWLAAIDLGQILLLSALVGFTFFGPVLWRFRRMGAADRRRTRPAIVAGVLVAVFQTTLGIWDALWDMGVTAVQNETALSVVAVGTHLSYLAIPIALAVGTLSTRLAHAEVAGMVTTLRTAGTDDLTPALARVLGDPTTVVAVPAVPAAPDEGRGEAYVGLDGAVLDLGADGPGVRRTDLGDGAVLLTRESTAREDPALFTAAVEAVRLSLDNARLTARVRSQLAEVEASRARITTAADEARHRLERDLHDGAQQQLLGLGMSLVAARRAVPDNSPAAARLDEASAQLKDSLVELRQLSRGLRPALLAERGLEVALDDLRRRIPVPLSVRVDLLKRPAPHVEVTAYYVLAESLQNITRHAPGATATVTLHATASDLVVSVSDDGPGGAEVSRGSGLRGLSDRVHAVGGELDVDSPTGAGTTVTARLPLRAGTTTR